MSEVNFDRAIELLKQKEVVALPTETVYGLAARCDSDEALGKIFSTKKRPFFDPLILHVENFKQAKAYGQFDPASQLLCEHFWPGPLTLVLPKTEKVSALVNNGGDTVALRAPNHPLFLQTLKALKVPLAAPSANLFGKTSPTKAIHVLKEFDEKVPVLDGGDCEKGIESTVLEIQYKEKLANVLRPGVITGDEILAFLKSKDLDFKLAYPLKKRLPVFSRTTTSPRCPFFLSNRKKLFLIGRDFRPLLKLLSKKKLWN